LFNAIIDDVLGGQFLLLLTQCISYSVKLSILACAVDVA